METPGVFVWMAVGAGSALGGVMRHALTESVSRAAGPGFPWGTISVNVLGSGALGLLAAQASLAAPAWSPIARHAVFTGVLGGFTTFSTFSIQTVSLVQQGLWSAAVANVAGSVLLGLGACWLGFQAGLALGR